VVLRYRQRELDYMCNKQRSAKRLASHLQIVSHSVGIKDANPNHDDRLMTYDVPEGIRPRCASGNLLIKLFAPNWRGKSRQRDAGLAQGND